MSGPLADGLTPAELEVALRLLVELWDGDGEVDHVTHEQQAVADKLANASAEAALERVMQRRADA